MLASSKTAAEIMPLRAELGASCWPAIVENGAGILPAGDGYDPDPGDAVYRDIRKILDSAPTRLRRAFAGIGDWGVDEIVRRTGLTGEGAELAARRQFSEPGVWSGTDSELPAFFDYLAGHGVTAHSGGRFLTLSFGADKADRMKEIAGNIGSRKTKTVALGDAPNDVRMIELADIGVVVHNPLASSMLKLEGERTGRIRRTGLPGPAGWNRAVVEILSKQGLI